jgi:glycosyltransferase involved in cell wall biosynthesis
MRILMVAPQPFLRARGTPLSVFHRIRALGGLGHSVELVTYPFGDDVSLPGMVIRRGRRPPGVRDVGIGPSVAKLMLDVPLFALATRLARSGGYDLVHTHEEAGVWGSYVSRRYGIPHVYDMHSSLPEQFVNFGRFAWPPVIRAFGWLEAYTLGGSTGVIAICDELRDLVRARGYGGEVAVIENVLQFTSSRANGKAAELRSRLAAEGDRLVVYTGTFEAYQGLDLLVSAAREVRARLPRTRFIVVGGTPAQVERLRGDVRKQGVESMFTVLAAVSPVEVQHYHEIADVLVTCRTRGTNTPLKVYHYLHAGRPIVATAIRSHTQILDAGVAELVEPTPGGVAAGIVRVLTDESLARSLAERAARFARTRYDEATEVGRLGRFLDQVRARSAGPVQ